jgi:ribosomal protein S18 acetylase RimI-like enzyme
MEVAIRFASKKDIEECQKIHNFDKTFLETCCENSGWQLKKMQIVVATVNDQVVGMMLAGVGSPKYLPVVSQDHLYLAHIAVLDEFQKKQIGTRLVGHLLEEARNHDIKLIRAECNGSKEWLVQWYRSFGFEIVPYTGDNKDYIATGQVILHLEMDLEQ